MVVLKKVVILYFYLQGSKLQTFLQKKKAGWEKCRINISELFSTENIFLGVLQEKKNVCVSRWPSSGTVDFYCKLTSIYNHWTNFILWFSWYFAHEDSTYDALEKDIAHVNIFFGQSHCLGETKNVCLPITLNAEYGRDLKRTMAEILVDMARFFQIFSPLWSIFFGKLVWSLPWGLHPLIGGADLLCTAWKAIEHGLRQTL